MTHSVDTMDVGEAGIWSWSVSENRVFADTALASLFGIDPDEALHGLPIERYIERIHQDDRARISKAISDAVVTGAPYHDEYRVIDYSGKTRWVIAFGRCFRDATGNPTVYAGIAHPLDEICDTSDLDEIADRSDLDEVSF